MSTSLFNVMAQESLAIAISKELSECDNNDILIPMVVKAVTTADSLESIWETDKHNSVAELKNNFNVVDFSLESFGDDPEEDRIEQMSRVLDTLDFKETKYHRVTSNEELFVEGVLDALVRENIHSLEASAFKKKEKGSGGIMRAIDTVVRSLLKFIYLLIQNFITFLAKAASLFASLLGMVDSLVKRFGEMTGLRNVAIDDKVEAVVKNLNSSDIKKVSKELTRILKEVERLNVEDTSEFESFQSVCRKVLPGDFENLSSREYVRTLFDPVESKDSKKTLVSVQNFLNLARKIDKDHVKAMEKITRSVKRVEKNIRKTENEVDKRYNKGSSSDMTTEKKAEFNMIKKRLAYVKKVLQTCTMVEDVVIREEVRISKMIKDGKPDEEGKGDE